MSRHIIHVTDHNQYLYYLDQVKTQHIITLTDCVATSNANSILPGYHILIPDIAPFHRLIHLSNLLKKYAFELNPRGSPSLLPQNELLPRKESCIDCILIIQRDEHHRRIVGMETGTFTEVVISIMKLNIAPVQIATLEGLSSIEQMRLFADAKIVIAIHGKILRLDGFYSLMLYLY